MNALVTLDGSAAPLFEADVNTDTIAPLYRESKGGAAKAGERTQDETRAQSLPQPPLRRCRQRAAVHPEPAAISQRAISDRRPDFACGSSRETAATMLAPSASAA